MKILHVVSSLPTPERPYDKPFVQSQIESLKKQNIDIEILNIRGYERAINYALGIFRLRKLVKTEKFDVVHAHYSYCGWCSIFQRRVPVIISLMGSDVYGSFNKKGRQTIKGFLTIMTTRILIKFVKAVIVKSRGMSAQVRHAKLFVLPNGVDFNFFKPCSRMIAKGTSTNFCRRILFLSNPNDPHKNFALAKRAYEIVSKKLRDVVLITPFGISQSEVVRFMNTSEVLLLTSLREGSPNIIKEAMACNLPIVSTDVGDVREIIGNTEGCFVTSYVPDDVANCIMHALKYGKRTEGRKKIGHLNIDIAAKKLIKIYDEVREFSCSVC